MRGGVLRVLPWPGAGAGEWQEGRTAPHAKTNYAVDKPDKGGSSRAVTGIGASGSRVELT